jgi:hypothetical protein
LAKLAKENNKMTLISSEMVISLTLSDDRIGTDCTGSYKSKIMAKTAPAKGWF